MFWVLKRTVSMRLLFLRRFFRELKIKIKTMDKKLLTIWTLPFFSFICPCDFLFDLICPSQHFFSYVETDCGALVRLEPATPQSRDKQPCLLLCLLFDLMLNVPSTIFQLNRDRSSWVEPALS